MSIDEMAVSKPRKNSSPISVKRNNRQMNGFYVHSSPPKVLQVHSSIIRQWLRAGDLNQLELLVLEGQGHKLVGEYSPDPKTRNFLKQIPAFLVKTKKMHHAISKGDLKLLQKLFFSIKSHEPPMKNIHLSKNQGGLSLLHKAVYYGQPHIVEFLVLNFPQLLKLRDNDEKTPLHYCGASKEAGKIWPILINAGADATSKDAKGRHPAYYMERSNEIQIPEEKILSGISASSTGLIIKPSNIRIWIHDRDIKKLQQVLWEGQGAKLRVETSKHPKVKRFLEGVPYILNIIKEVHSSVVNNNFEEFLKKTSDPIPVEILGSKDINGLTPLHKAAGLNRKKIAENILMRSPNLVFSTDQEGRTPLHYAATLKDDSAVYNLLTESHADETAVDKNGKTASYYKANPKEISAKFLEVIPEAPRTSATFPSTFDWSLFHPNGVEFSSRNSLFNIISSVKIDKNRNRDELKESVVEEEDGNVPEEDFESKLSESKDKISMTESESTVQTEDRSDEVIEESEKNKSFDIWTNNGAEAEENIDVDQDDDHDDDDDNDDDDDDDDNNNDNDDDDGGDNKQNKNAELDEIRDTQEFEANANLKEGNIGSSIKIKKEVNDLNDKKNAKENSTVPQVPDTCEALKENKMRQKTEREIAEERQRLLDEGLLRINADNETESEDAKVNQVIEAGDMEKLASMVLNGEGDKLRGKVSTNPEIQSFLDNTPTYMTKITAVHKAAKTGSLKDLQAALDRRKFAIAKESSDKLGATPLHAAVIFRNISIVKYLGGRFPETLITKDKFGRTPLHYAATLQDDGLMYNSLLNLGADSNVKDNEGHTPKFYLNNAEIRTLTREKLLEEMNFADRLSNEHINLEGVSSPVTDPSIHTAEPEISFDEGIPLSKNSGNEDAEEDNNDNSTQSNFSLTDRDEYGQSVLHFAAARAHGRGGLYQLIHESGVNLGYRDELYRTARDIAQQANIPENANEIDKYVISLASKGETGKLIELFLEGYDHILDLEDDEDNDIMTIASNKNHDKTLAFLKAIPGLEEKRERIHRAVRAGDCKLVESLTAESKNGRFFIIGKNASGRCSLHIAVLCQQKDITEFIAQKFPETLRIGDNLERTPLHYAMGVEEVEVISKILIKCGAKRVVKDLKGRQPTYYFMNKTEILKLQEDENILKV